MAVLFNFKICDNAKECGGLAVCPTGAISWDEEKETLVIDNDKCISCGMCEKECPIGAISVAKNDEEYNEIKTRIDNDPRTTKDLFVDRFGAAAISEFFMINLDEIQNKVARDGLTLIEIYNPEYAECLLKSIPIKDLTDNLDKDTLYFKAEANDVVSEYGIEELPSLLVFKNGDLLGHIDGYYTTDEKEEFVNKLNDIINNA